MSSAPSPELRGDLLDDFYAECDELLGVVRDGLTRLEGRPEGSAPEDEILQRLFRSTHSLKGNASIVGLRPAEQLAHGMEDVLRALTKRELALNEALLEALIEAAQRLEKTIAAHRAQTEPPEIQEISNRLRGLPPSSAKGSRATEAEPAVSGEPSADPLATARRRGVHVRSGDVTGYLVIVLGIASLDRLMLELDDWETRQLQ